MIFSGFKPDMAMAGYIPASSPNVTASENNINAMVPNEKSAKLSWAPIKLLKNGKQVTANKSPVKTEKNASNCVSV